jgi:hypothetical protein
MARLITDDLGVALIPDDYRAGTAFLPGPDPLIVPGGQGVVLDRDGQPPDTGIQQRAFGNRPRAQDLADLDPEIEMQRRHGATLQSGTVASIIGTAALLKVSIQGTPVSCGLGL